MFKQNYPIVLASGSPRRKEYLERYQLNFRILTADIGEEIKKGESPLTYVRRMAEEKNQAVSAQVEPNEIVISADTIVIFEDQIIGKPKSEEDAVSMLKMLNGEIHQVITAYLLSKKDSGIRFLRHTSTFVQFKTLPKAWIRGYVQTGEPLDKAGSYSVQGIGTFLVENLQGSYNNVVGLPIELLLEDFIQHNWISFT